MQVLEVLTAAVEYGLEELREVGVSGRPSCSLAFPVMVPFAQCDLTQREVPQLSVYTGSALCAN